MSVDRRRRLLALLVFVGALFGTVVLYGTVTYDPALNDYPTEDDVAPTPEAYIGERVSLHGEVVATDPVVVAVDAGEDWRVTLEGADAGLVRGGPPTTDERVSAHGTLTDRDTLATERAYTREPWEWTYMYAVSVVGAVWVLGRALTGWRFDRERLAVVPREGAHRVTDRLAPSSGSTRADTAADTTADDEPPRAAGDAGGEERDG